MLSFIISILIIGFLVFIHELGHFITAKRSNIKVEAFGFGFGPKIFGFRIREKGLEISTFWKKTYQTDFFSGKEGETEYRLDLFPLGGYVRMMGEDGEVSHPRSFSAQKAIVRLKVIVAGVTINFLFGALLFYIILFNSGFQVEIPKIYSDNFNFIGSEDKSNVYITMVSTDSPAERSGIEPMDRVLSIDGQEISSTPQLQKIVGDNTGKDLNLVVKRGEETVDYTVYARENPPEGERALGVGLLDVYNVDYSGSLITKASSGFLHSYNILSYTLKTFGNLIGASFQDKDIAPVSDNVTGIIGIYATTTDVVTYGGWKDVLSLTALLSLSLAMINIFPIPILDGGHVVLILIEMIRRGKKLSNGFIEWYSRVGFVFLIGLSLLVTVKDLVQFQILDKIKGLF